MKDKKNKEEIIDGVDHDGNKVRALVKLPTPKDYRDSQVAYNKAFRQALDSGALLRQKLNDYMRSQNLWDDEKQKKYERIVNEISSMEDVLKGGGIRLSEAKKIALDLRNKRDEFKELLAERNALDANSAEGQADNARFGALIRLCVLNPDTKTPYFPEEKDYDAQSSQPWVISAAEKLGGLLYGLDPNYEKNLEENKFLREFEFVNDELKFINKDGHTTDSEGRLINEDGRYVAYRNDEDYKGRQNAYFVNRDGEEVVQKDDSWIKASIAERRPFLDEDNNPIIKNEETPTVTPEPVQVVKEEIVVAPAPVAVVTEKPEVSEPVVSTLENVTQ